MRGKMMLLGGLAAGFVLGSRAGRQAYDGLVNNMKKVREHPTVQEAVGTVQNQANRLYAQGKDTVGDKLSHSRLGDRLHIGAKDQDLVDTETPKTEQLPSSSF